MKIRSRLKHVLVLSIVGGLVAGVQPAAAAGPDAERTGDPTPPASEIIVRYRSGTRTAERAAVRSHGHARFVRSLALRRTELVRPTAGTSVDEAIKVLRTDPNVASAEPNLVRTIASHEPNDIGSGLLWGLDTIDAPEAWHVETGNPEIVVAVIDTGVAVDHPEFAGRIWTNPGESALSKRANGVDDDGNGFVDDWRGWDFVNDDPDPRDFSGHGTHVAGTIAADGNNGGPAAGVSWDTTIMPLRAGDANGAFQLSDILDAYAYAARMGARIVNGSFGGGPFSIAEAHLLEQAAETLFVFAAGNDNADADQAAEEYFPCEYGARFDLENILCVAASTAEDGLASFSNYGAESVHLAAPGEDIMSTSPVWTSVFYDDFETDITGRWSTGGTNNTWARTTAAKSEGSFSLTDSPGGDYLNDTDSYARTVNKIDLTDEVGCRVSYDMAIETEIDYDSFSVEISYDGTTWHVLEGWWGGSGTAAPFEMRDVEASVLDGTSFYVRLHLVSDNINAFDGVYVDNFAVWCLDAPINDDTWTMDGTSVAAPHVAGAAALVWSQVPSASVAYVRDQLLDTVDLDPAFAGKTTTGGRLNVLRALDTTAPAMLLDPGPFASPFTVQTSLGVSWNSVDAESGVKSNDVAQRSANHNGSFGSSTAFKSNTSAKSGTLTLSAGRTYCLSARARDMVGNVSAYTAERCVASPVASTQLAHSKGWTKDSGAGYYRAGYSQSKTKGATLSLSSVQAKRISLVATKCSGCGSVEVWLGNELLKTVSLSARSTAKAQQITISTFPSVRSGTLKIKVATQGKPVKIEGVGVSRV